MEITEERISKLYTLQAENDALEEEVSEALKKAHVDDNRQVIIKRKKTGRVELSQKLLWDEVYNLGPDCEAGKFLKKKYPLVFSKSEEQGIKAREINAYAMAELGINSDKMKLTTILKLIEAVVDYKLKQKDENVA